MSSTETTTTVSTLTQNLKPLKKMTIYIAGPMRGYQQWNFPEFHRVAAEIEQAGHVPIDPALIDEMLGFSPRMHPDSELTSAFIRKVILRDLHLIADEADALVMLGGWLGSKGAVAEHSLARCLRLLVFDREGELI